VALRKTINTSKIFFPLIYFVSLLALTGLSIGHPAFGPIYTVSRQSTVEYICLFLRLLPASSCPLVLYLHLFIVKPDAAGQSCKSARGGEGANY